MMTIDIISETDLRIDGTAPFSDTSTSITEQIDGALDQNQIHMGREENTAKNRKNISDDDIDDETKEMYRIYYYIITMIICIYICILR